MCFTYKTICVFMFLPFSCISLLVLPMVACDSTNDNDYDDDVNCEWRHHTIQYNKICSLLAPIHTISALFHSSFVFTLKRDEEKTRNFVSTLICAAHETRKPTYASHHYTSLRELTDNGRTSQI